MEMRSIFLFAAVGLGVYILVFVVVSEVVLYFFGDDVWDRWVRGTIGLPVVYAVLAIERLVFFLAWPFKYRRKRIFVEAFFLGQVAESGWQLVVERRLTEEESKVAVLEKAFSAAMRRGLNQEAHRIGSLLDQCRKTVKRLRLLAQMNGYWMERDIFV